MTQSNQDQTTMYDGKLTAWASAEADKILEPLLPPIGKLYEGKNSLEVKVRDPRWYDAREAIIALAREYAAKQQSGSYEHPQDVTGEVDHGSHD